MPELYAYALVVAAAVIKRFGEISCDGLAELRRRWEAVGFFCTLAHELGVFVAGARRLRLGKRGKVPRAKQDDEKKQRQQGCLEPGCREHRGSGGFLDLEAGEVFVR